MCPNPAASTLPLLVGLAASPPAMPRATKPLVFFRLSLRPPSSLLGRHRSHREAAAPPPPSSLVTGAAPSSPRRSHRHLRTAGATAIRSCAAGHGPAPLLVHRVGRAMAFGCIPGRALTAPVGCARRGCGPGGSMHKRVACTTVQLGQDQFRPVA
jgi:hypothetical protein